MTNRYYICFWTWMTEDDCEFLTSFEIFMMIDDWWLMICFEGDANFLDWMDTFITWLICVIQPLDIVWTIFLMIWIKRFHISKFFSDDFSQFRWKFSLFLLSIADFPSFKMDFEVQEFDSDLLVFYREWIHQLPCHQYFMGWILIFVLMPSGSWIYPSKSKSTIRHSISWDWFLVMFPGNDSCQCQWQYDQLYESDCILLDDDLLLDGYLYSFPTTQETFEFVKITTDMINIIEFLFQHHFHIWIQFYQLRLSRYWLIDWLID
jgi:hypothetical protein